MGTSSKSGDISSASRSRTGGRTGRFSELHKTFARLAEYPEFGSHRDRFGPAALVFPKAGYLVLYRAVDEGIEVVRVTGGDEDVFADA